MYQSEAILRPEALPAIRALMGKSDGLYFMHKLVWSLFPNAGPERGERPFLYDMQGDRPIRVILRSSVEPQNALGCWDIRTVPFDPKIQAGDRLMFRTKAVATVARNIGRETRGKPQDVVVATWMSLPDERRKVLSHDDVADVAALEWLERQGSRSGFSIANQDLVVQRYEQVRFRKPGAPRGGDDIRFGYLELCGELVVTDPSDFRRMLFLGLGRERGFGFGMVHVARAKEARSAA